MVCALCVISSYTVVSSCTDQYTNFTMNTVDYLLQNRFSSHTLEVKLEIKRLGCHQPNDFTITQKGKAQNRNFSTRWFEQNPWLTCSISKKSLFWTKHGYSDMKHLSRGIKLHNKNSNHLTACLKLEMFGKVNIGVQLDDGYRLSVRRHNQEVDRNRYILSRIIDCINFCGKFELALRGHDESPESNNAGIFRGLIDFVAVLDGIIAEHLDNATVFKGTSKTIQNELLECMYQVYLEQVATEIESAKFIGIQADETTDVSCKGQVVVIIRYTLEGEVKERFICFEETKEKDANTLTKILTNILSRYNVKDKLVAQTYDGAATMKGRINGVQAQVRQEYPHAHFTHCYAHQLNLIMQQACAKQIRHCKVFFANLSAFPVFFSSSPKRSSALKEFCSAKVPRAAATRWNFNSRTVNAIYENRDALLECLTAICHGLSEEEQDREDLTKFEWDNATINEAAGLIKWLTDEEFLFFLKFFHQVLSHVDILYAVFQKREISVDEVNKQVKSFTEQIAKARSNIDSLITSAGLNESPSGESVAKRRRIDVQVLKGVCKEACDIMLVQVSDRFSSIGNLIPLQLVDPNLFPNHAAEFPHDKIAQVSLYYPMIQTEKLRTELNLLYTRKEFHGAKSSSHLLQFMIENNLSELTFSEVCKLLDISLTTPLASAESERGFSTLNRIKTFLRNTMTNERLNALAALSIQKDLIRDLPNFNQRVIDKFAASKDRRIHLLYKSCSRDDPYHN